MQHDEVTDNRVVQLSVMNHGDYWLRTAQAEQPTHVIIQNDMNIEQINDMYSFHRLGPSCLIGQPAVDRLP